MSGRRPRPRSRLRPRPARAIRFLTPARALAVFAPSPPADQSLGTAFYRGADACVLVYDVSDALSFTKLESWRTAFLQAADVKDPQTFPFVVLGNKADLEAPKHIVQASQVAAWCEKHNKIPTFLVRTDWRGRSKSPVLRPE